MSNPKKGNYMIILDVREKEEFEAEHIPESISLPLSQFDMLAPGIIKNLKESEVIVMCHSGNRSKMAITELQKLDVDHHKFSSFDGGIVRWKAEGKPVQGKGTMFPIMRQVQIVASSMIFIAFLAAAFINPSWVYLALFVGFGLSVAGWTGFCPMANILQRMPWNNKKIGSCGVSNNNCCG